MKCEFYEACLQRLKICFKMKKFIVCALPIYLIIAVSCTSKERTLVYFDNFTYHGMDIGYEIPIDSQNFYFNPILSGSYSQPSICNKGDKYYLTTASYNYFPGIPVFESNDLVNWDQIGHAIDRIDQLNMDTITFGKGIYSSGISYNEKDEMFYLLAECNNNIGNFILKSENPHTGWSDPCFLDKIEGHDLSMFIDNSNDMHIVYCKEGVNGNDSSMYESVYLAGYDPIRNIIGESTEIFINSYTNLNNRLYLKTPRIYEMNDKYYLLTSMGSRGDNIEDMAFVSDNVYGPYIYDRGQKILSQKDLPSSRRFKVTETSNAQLIKNNNDDWYALFKGSRPYDDNKYNTGKETFLLPVIWKDGFPKIDYEEDGIPIVNQFVSCNLRNNTNNGNFFWKDGFDNEILDQRWVMIRTPHEKWYSVNNGSLNIKPSKNSIFELKNPSFVGRRQQHMEFESTVDINFTPVYDYDFAGMACYLNNEACYLFGKSRMNGKEVIIFKGPNTYSNMIYTPIPKDKTKVPLKLKTVAEMGTYIYYYSFDNGSQWRRFYHADASLISNANIGGEGGVLIGLYAFSAEKLY